MPIPKRDLLLTAFLISACAHPTADDVLAFVPTPSQSAECGRIEEPDERITHSAASRYFTVGTFDSRPELDALLRNWFSLQLCAMGEPSMQEIRRSGTRLRFLWLRSFDPGISVRIDIDDDEARLTAAKLTGYGGGQAGSLARRVNSKLSSDQVERIKSRIEADSLWTLPLHHKRTDGMVTFDGAEWVMEISEPGRYHIVKRTSGREIKKLGLLLLQLSDLDTEPIY